MSKSHSPTVKEGKDNNKAEQLVRALKMVKSLASIKMAKVLLLFCFFVGTGLALQRFNPASTTIECFALYAFANDGVISGRQSNSVKTRNGIERMFVVPRLVRNTFTSLVRNTLGLLSTLWNGLDDGQRASYNSTEGDIVPNRLGRSIVVRGKALFISRGAASISVGGSAFPVFPGYATIEFNTAVNGNFVQTAGVMTTATVAFDNSPVPAGSAFGVWATAPLSAGTSRPKQSAYRLIQVVAAAGTTPVNILTAYIARFGSAAQADQKVGVYIKVVNTETGQAGVPLGDVSAVG